MAIPHTFTAGTSAASSEVNANFSNLLGSMPQFVGSDFTASSVDGTGSTLLGSVTIPANTLSKWALVITNGKCTLNTVSGNPSTGGATHFVIGSAVLFNSNTSWYTYNTGATTFDVASSASATNDHFNAFFILGSENIDFTEDLHVQIVGSCSTSQGRLHFYSLIVFGV